MKTICRILKFGLMKLGLVTYSVGGRFIRLVECGRNTEGDQGRILRKVLTGPGTSVLLSGQILPFPSALLHPSSPRGTSGAADVRIAVVRAPISRLVLSPISLPRSRLTFTSRETSARGISAILPT